MLPPVTRDRQGRLTAGTLLLVTVLAPAVAAAESAIERRIARRLRSFRGLMGVAAIHLDTGETVALDADRRFPTASAIKTAVMVEVFHQMVEGRLRKDQLLTLTEAGKVGGSGVLRDLRAPNQYSVGDLLHLMIALSDNTATNLLVDLVGTQSVNARMAAYGLPLTRLYRGTFRGGRADAFPEEEKEFGLGSSTPREMARLMEKIARGQAVSRQASAEMMELLGRQQFREMVPRRLPEAEGLSVGNKTGSDEEKLPDRNGFQGAIRNDAAIVTTPRGRYVIAIFTRRVRDKRWTVDNEALVAGADVSRMVFEHFNKP